MDTGEESKVTDLAGKKLFLLDMDGTLYLDDRLFTGVREFLERIRRIGGTYYFLTTNSSRGIDAYLAKMKRLGLPAGPSDFLTSVDVTIDFLRRERPGRVCYVLGTASFEKQLREAGIRTVTEPVPETDILLCGYDTELTYRKLVDASFLLGQGAEFLATNPDWVCPCSFGYVPDCGSICEMLRRATGRTPRFLGKPEPGMALLALRRSGFPAEKAVLIGDRVYTDIACAVKAGIDSILVLSGEGVVSDCEKYGYTPTRILDDIAAVYQEILEEERHLQ